MAVKRAVRPLIPDRIMARYRLRQHSRAVRVNVDVAVADRAEARRWLATTPDTYRIIDADVLGDPPTNGLIVVSKGADVSGATRLLSRQDIGAAVVGEVAPRSVAGRRRAEPVIAPIAIVARSEVLDDVGGVPADSDLPALLDRIRDAGHRFGLVPVPPAGAGSTRRDPIQADPVVILAAVPMHDVGGGSRGAQLALELVARGYHVVYVHLYPSYEQVDLGLRFVHPQLEQARFDRFDPSALVGRTPGKSGTAILEVPSPEYLTAVTGLQNAGWDIVYDVIDDWSDLALGGDWYDPGLERHYLETVEAVSASASDLVSHAEKLDRTAVLVPNAVNAAIFAPGETTRPSDLPDGRIIGYHGSLYGDWFDWDALAAVARRNHDARVVLIGEARGVPAGLPGNVALLGLKAQEDLPAYLSRFDVGIVPFAVTNTTHAVSPLKVYEYLASGVPVAAPPLRSLDGLDGVYTDADLGVAVAEALEAPPPDPSVALDEHAWGNRLATILDSVGRELAEPTNHPVKIERRPAVHYPRSKRKVIPS